MMNAVRSGAVGLATAGLVVTAGANSAMAADWSTVDTDNISRAVASGRTYTTNGAFKWQKSGTGWVDYRATWSAQLNLNGPANSCARLRIITHLEGGSISKRWPAAGTTPFGYYSLCSSTGKASRVYSGTDDSLRDIGNAPEIVNADISVCYAPNNSTPATECYNFRIHKGD